MNAIFIGPPGAGKGTQVERLLHAHDIVQIATGNLLRAAVKEGTPLGIEAKRYMDVGDLVPDDVMFGLVHEHMTDIGDHGVIFDGFPRNVAQADRLTQELEDIGRALTGVVLFEIDPEVVVQRISGRRTCTTCGRAFHVEFSPPPANPPCERGYCEVIQRDDDREEIVRVRLRSFESQTRPLVAYYEERGLLHRVDASLSPDEVAAQIRSALLDPA